MIEIEKPKALVLTAPGINRDEATQAAYELAGAQADIVHINQLITQEVSLDPYQIFSIPGGFSYGDHIQSGVIMSLQFAQNVLSDQIYQHLDKGRLILGVCNGFQVLVQCGLLPFGKIHTRDQNQATLTANIPNQFQSRWIHLQSEESRCLFIEPHEVVTFPVAHGEGRFLTKDPSLLTKLFAQKQIVYYYSTQDGIPTMEYPLNPNGSSNAIAAICDPSGQILGMMPHAEDFVLREQHPNWRRISSNTTIDGLQFFKQVVAYAKDL